MTRRALLLLPESPYPPRCGNALRDAQQIHILRAMGFEMCLAIIMPRHDLTPEEESEGLRDIPVRYATKNTKLHETLTMTCWRKASYVLGSRRNAFAWWTESLSPDQFLSAAVAEHAPALVMIRSLFVHFLASLRRAYSGQLIVDCHDADVHLAKEMVKTVSGMRKLGPWANLQAVRRACRAYLPLANEVWAVSDEDADRIRKDVPTAKVLVVPSGLEPVPDPRPRPGDDRTVLIVANYGYGPNAHAVAWLLANVWPLVRQSIPDARLELVGGRMPQELHGLASGTPGVRVHGMVEKLDPFYDQAGVVAVPILEGSGTRLKVVDAWRHGKAVIATPKGIEGLPVSEGVVVAANDPGQFAGLTIQLLKDEGRRRAMGEAALRHFKRTLSWEAVTEVVLARSMLSHPAKLQTTSVSW